MADDMRDYRYRLGVVAGLIVLTVLVINRADWLHRSRSEATNGSPLTVNKIESARTAELPSTFLLTTQSPNAIPAIPHSRLRIDQIIGSSTDLMPLLQSALTDAWRGDSAAQYYASAILRACGDDLPSSTMEDRRDQVERLRKASQLSVSALDNIEKSADRCKAVWEAARSDIGFGGDWLMKAAEGGLPQAMFDQALSIDPTIPEDQRELFLRDAIDSGDPDVMRSIASEFFAADAESPAQRITAVALVACDFGADCGAGSDQLLTLLSTTSSEESPEEGFTVQEWIEQHLSDADRQNIESQASDFAARAREHQLAVGLTQDANKQFTLTFNLSEKGSR
jgi:hypothetical protein